LFQHSGFEHLHQSKQVQVPMLDALKVEEDTQGQARLTYKEATQAVQNQ